MRLRLDKLLPSERSERSRRIAQQILGSSTWHEASCVLLFAPLPTEPDLDLLWQGDALTGKQVAYPQVEGAGMKLYHLCSVNELEPARWGLREPPPHAARETMLDDVSLVLVPGLAFDAAGGRLGRGGGYYDRLLASRDPAKTRLVGVGFAFQLIPEPLPLAAHDVRMDEVCTD